MGVNYGGAIAIGNNGDSAMDGRMAAQLQWVMVATTRGDVVAIQV
jgi:hypothetical protein